MELLNLNDFIPYDSPVSLYVHIPFCGKKCGYCDFFSVENSPEEFPGFMDGLQRQLEYFTEELGISDFETVFIGGGTPNVLPVKMLEEVLKCIAAKTGKNCLEWSIELNPEHLVREHISLFNDSPVTRLSLGIQSFFPRFLQVLGRSAGAEDIQRALDLIKTAWKGDLSLDLICSISGQDGEDLLRDLDAALSFQPNHISLYTLSLEEGTPMYDEVQKGSVIENDVNENYESWQRGISYLQNNGFRRYEISNFAPEGYECLHNLRYWRMRPYIGCGPGAVSTVTSGNSRFRIENDKNLHHWEMQIEELKNKDFILEFIMMGLRLSEGIGKQKFFREFGIQFQDIFKNNLKNWISRGLVLETSDQIVCTPRGWDVLNILLREAAAVLDSTSA